MGDARSLHPGHSARSPLVATGDAGVPLAPACCADRNWIVAVDGERMRLARKRAGLSQEELADASGMSVRTICELERRAGQHCHFRTRALIAAALGEHPKAISAAAAGQSSGVVTLARFRETAGPGWKCSRTFPGLADQVGRARVFLRPMLAGCPVGGDLLVICSELAANAVLHSASSLPGGRFTVRAEVREGDYAGIEVEDDGGRWDRKPRSDERGRGLLVVDELAAYWDIRGDDTGRIVCAAGLAGLSRDRVTFRAGRW